jgi:hypothetical protein
MANKKLTEKEKKYIRKNRSKKSSREIGNDIGVSKSAVLRLLKVENLQPSKEMISIFRKRNQMKKTTATKKEDLYIKANYLELPIKRIAKNIGRSNIFISTRLRQLELEVPDHIIKKNIEKGRFNNGHVPFIKGKKIEDFYSPEAMEKVKDCWFKKGHIPANASFDGAITIVNGYKWKRVSVNNWIQLHIYNWEKEHGELPDGMMLAFKDGDQMSCETNNLQPITRAENMVRNSIMRYPPELQKSLRLMGKLNKKIQTKTQKNEQ